MPSCSLLDCPNKHYGKGFCEKHYDRWRRYGDPYITKRRGNGEGSIAKEILKEYGSI